MIGFIKQPTGRMGNVLIQYIFLRQAAEYIGADYFHPELPYVKYFEGFEKRKCGIRQFIKKKWKVDNQYIQKIGLKNFLEEARLRNEKDDAIVLIPPVLGHLLDFENSNPRDYIVLKKRDYIAEVKQSKAIEIGIHFRGGDFKAWNEQASLSFDYYVNSIKYCIEYFNNTKLRFSLYTDDDGFQPYLSCINFLQNCNYNFVSGNPHNDMIVDFVKLSQSQVIISSPSTFAIMAGLIGTPHKKIIHSKEWMDYCVKNNDGFWIKLLENKSSYYNLWKAI